MSLLQGNRSAPPPGYSPEAAKLLAGAVDFHVHAGPDARPRRLNYLKLAMRAEEVGMAALVVKSHHTFTGDIARIMEETAPGARFFGGVTLNRSVGGFNCDAARASHELGGAIIWLPTHDAQNELRYEGRDVASGLTVLDDFKRLREDVRDILAWIAEMDTVLCTGHLSGEETLAVVEAARDLGVRSIVVNHPEHVCNDLDVAIQCRLASMGAVMERCYPRDNCVTDFEGIARIIRDVGPESSLIGTDLGRVDLVDPVTGMGQMIDELLSAGFSEDEVRFMTRDLPCRILGIEPR